MPTRTRSAYTGSGQLRGVAEVGIWGSRGVTRGRASQLGAASFQAGGSVIGVLPEAVERRLKEASTRSAVANGQAVLVSPYHPAAAFSAGAAMGRNKLVYALADVALVVSSAEGSGGTWTGALEAINGGWVPVLVRDDPGVPEGNRALVTKGALPLRAADISDSVSVADLVALALTRGRHMAAEAPQGYRQETPFDRDS